MQTPPLFTLLVPLLQHRSEWHSTICSLSLGKRALSESWDTWVEVEGTCSQFSELFPISYRRNYFSLRFRIHLMTLRKSFEILEYKASPQLCITLITSEWWTCTGCAGETPLSCLAHNMYLMTAAGPKLILSGCSIKILLHAQILLKRLNSFLFLFRRRSWRWATSYVHQSVHLRHPLAVSSPGSAGGCNPDCAPCPFPRK